MSGESSEPEKIEVGDTVYLKSGGPPMVVIHFSKKKIPEAMVTDGVVAEIDVASCEWFSLLPGGIWSASTTCDDFAVATITKTPTTLPVQ